MDTNLAAVLATAMVSGAGIVITALLKSKSSHGLKNGNNYIPRRESEASYKLISAAAQERHDTILTGLSNLHIALDKSALDMKENIQFWVEKVYNVEKQQQDIIVRVGILERKQYD